MIARYLGWTGLSIVVAWLVYKASLIDIVMLFLIAGAIPGTNILLPPIVMLVILSVCLLLTAVWLKKQQFAVQIRTMKARHEAVRVPRPQISESAAKRRNRQLLTHWITIILLTFRLRTTLAKFPSHFGKKWVRKLFSTRVAKGRQLFERGIIAFKR